MTSGPHAQPQPPTSFREVIARWPATRSLARDAGCSAPLVRQWRHRNFIPPQYWPAILAGAGRRGIGGVDAVVLAGLAAALRGGERAAPVDPGGGRGWPR